MEYREWNGLKFRESSAAPEGMVMAYDSQGRFIGMCNLETGVITIPDRPLVVTTPPTP